MQAFDASDGRPRYDFGRSVAVRHIFGSTYEWITLDGRHIHYVVALDVRYEPTLFRQYMSTRKQ